MAIIISVFLVHSHAISGISSIRASGDISGVSITTVTGTMSSTSCNIQTTNGTVSGKNGLFQKSVMHRNKSTDYDTYSCRGMYVHGFNYSVWT